MASADVETFLTLFLGTGYDDPTAIRALAIGYAESGGRGGIVSPANSNGTRDYGFLQINSVHFTEPEFVRRGWNAQTMLQIGPNIDAGRYLSNGWKNWRPWSTFNSGSYLTHVAQATADVKAWHDKKGSGNPISAVQAAAGNVADGVSGMNPAAIVSSVIGWLNPLTTAIAVGVLGVLLVAAGIWLIVQDEVAPQAAKVAKAIV